jgi:tetratricopeptide (TPR) repeat protein
VIERGLLQGLARVGLVGVGLLVFATTPARAEPAGEAAAPGDDPDDLAENTITGAAPAAVPIADPSAVPPAAAASWAATSRLAADALGADVALVDATRSVVELVYRRKYKDARKALDGIEARFPGSGVSPTGMVFLYQALMFENYDFRYEKQYRLASAAARAELTAAAERSGNDAFESFLLAGLLGVDAIHAMRKEEFVVALGGALDAMRALDRTKTLAPGFKDTLLGDGMYLYWRSVVTRSSAVLPDFADRRAEGIALMRQAEEEATFLGPAASLAAAFAYVEERALPLALERGIAIRLRYPDNVIGNMTLGRIYTSMRRYDDALRMYAEVLEDDPANQRSHYFRGLVLARTGRGDDARKAYLLYLGFKDPPAELRGQAWYRLGALYNAAGELPKARSAYEQAVAASRNEAARRALARLENR